MKFFWIRFVSIMLISVFCMGSAGWLYIKHCCDSRLIISEAQCDLKIVEMDHACCKDKIKMHHDCCEKILTVEKNELSSNGSVHRVDDYGCCIEKANYFNVPLYRLHSSEEKKIELVCIITYFPVFKLQLTENESFKKINVPRNETVFDEDVFLLNQSFLI